MTTDESARLVVELVRGLSAARLLHAAERDYLAWLQVQVCRAREWSVPHLIAEWHRELDRRAHVPAIVTPNTRVA